MPGSNKTIYWRKWGGSKDDARGESTAGRQCAVSQPWCCVIHLWHKQMAKSQGCACSGVGQVEELLLGVKTQPWLTEWDGGILLLPTCCPISSSASGVIGFGSAPWQKRPQPRLLGWLLVGQRVTSALSTLRQAPGHGDSACCGQRHGQRHGGAVCSLTSSCVNTSARRGALEAEPTEWLWLEVTLQT